MQMRHLVYWFQTVTLEVFIREFLVLRSGRKFEDWFYDEKQTDPDSYATEKFYKMQNKFVYFICDLDSEGLKAFPIALENWYNKNHKPIEITKELLDSVVLESDIAKKMKVKGYRFAIVLIDDERNLYSKTISDAVKLMREDFKEIEYTIVSIDRVIEN